MKHLSAPRQPGSARRLGTRATDHGQALDDTRIDALVAFLTILTDACSDPLLAND